MKTVLAITLMNFRAIGGRLGTSMVIVVGIGCVVAVLIGMLSMSQGFERTLKGTGTDGRALILSSGAGAELPSGIGRDVIPLLRELPGIARDAEGRPVASAELIVITELRRGEGRQQANVNVSLRGVEPMGLSMRPEATLVEGRWFQPGLREVVVGAQAAQQFAGTRIGQVLHFRGSDWNVVGIFATGGDAHESEMWTDAETARSAFGRTASSSLLAQLESPAALQQLKDAVTSDPRFQLDVQSERAYFSSQSGDFSRNIGVLTSVVAGVMAFGALFGALNTMYSAVATRRVEIATLRAIGFSGAPVVVSVIAEAVVLALAGGLIGAAISYTLFNGMTVSTLGGNFTQVAFSFAVTPQLLARGLAWSVVIGLVGGLFPAVRAARVPIVVALRAG